LVVQVVPKKSLNLLLSWLLTDHPTSQAAHTSSMAETCEPFDQLMLPSVPVQEVVFDRPGLDLGRKK
jgi:hypothetical protein